MRFGLWAPRSSITTSSDLHAISPTAPSRRRRSRIPARWSLLLQPATALSPPRSCSKATSCSCLCLAALPDTGAHPSEHSHRDRCQRGMRPALVHEHQSLGDDLLGHHHPPGCPLELVAFRSNSSPFFLVEPMRAMARHMVERLTASPVIASM